ncbi:MAG: S49 family peptidase [Haloarculaceae archaeon]
MGMVSRLGRTLIALLFAAAVGVAAWYVFVQYPVSFAQLAGIVIAALVTVAGLQAGLRVASQLVPDYNVAEVPVEGPITRDSGGFGIPAGPTRPDADEVVEQIERADADRNTQALVLRLNTPGGEIVPADDIREAAIAFDGPTVAYATDTCASGGMWVASGCDRLWAREGSIVGSIGVRFGSFRVHEFLEAHGIEYEGITAGEYKESLSAFKQLEADEREYIQGLVDTWYDHFVERMAEGTDMDAAAVRATEAKVYLGEDAVETGLVDALGNRDGVEAHLEDRLGTPVEVNTFEPRRGITERLGAAASGAAFAFGAGLGRALGAGESGLRME